MKRKRAIHSRERDRVVCLGRLNLKLMILGRWWRERLHVELSYDGWESGRMLV